MAYSAAIAGDWGLIMATELRVIPELLGQVGAALERTGLSLFAVQQACHREADGAWSGWVGSSAHALSGVLDSWAAASTIQINRFGEHSCGMHYAAAEYTELEQRNATTLVELANAPHREQRATP